MGKDLPLCFQDVYKRQDLEERLSELRKVKFEGQVEAGLELLKALTDRGSGRLKNLDARLEKLDGQIREQAAYPVSYTHLDVYKRQTADLSQTWNR